MKFRVDMRQILMFQIRERVRRGPFLVVSTCGCCHLRSPAGYFKRDGNQLATLQHNPTNLFTILELQIPSHDVPEQHKIRRYPNPEALKM